MKIHPFEPLHHWRAFVGEIAVIVAGVIIALAAQQMVESAQDREQVRKSEESLRDNFKRFVTYSAELDSYAPCVVARATQVRQILDQSSAAHRLPRVGPIPQLPPHPWQIDTYSAMVASQAITHVSNDEAILYSRIAMSADDLHEASMTEWSDWGILAGLSGQPRSFGEAEEAQDRITLARAVHQDALMRTIADKTVERIRSTGLLDKQAFDSAIAEGRGTAAQIPMCRPIDIQH
jgi:hypothetical protein